MKAHERDYWASRSYGSDQEPLSHLERRQTQIDRWQMVGLAATTVVMLCTTTAVYLFVTIFS